MSSSPPASSPSSPPSTNSTAPPPSPLSAPPPSNSTSPPPSSLPAPPPSNSTFPAPSSLPAPPPSTPSAPPPSISSPPPPSTPSDIPTPAPPSPSPPDSTTPTPPAPVGKPPPSDHSPPPPKNHPSGRSPSSSSSSSISTTAVVGIAVGAVVIIALLSLLCIYCRKKRRRVQLPVGYYTGPPPPLPPQKDDLYGGQPQNWQHYASPPPADQVSRLSPQPPSPPPHASRPPYPPSQFLAPPPPPPPPVSSSSGGSGSVYSEPLPPPSPNYVLGFSKSTFTFEELIVATNGFSDANLLGQGGFGYVHKGVLPTGKEVAIKQLKSDSGQGEREFQAEVEIISRVHHKHLVTLVGYCMSEGQRLLVYEYVPNKTLEFHLHGKDVPVMDWPTRLKIALGAAKGLAYLHEDCQPKIIHRDIKAANILLDFKFEAKVADFGLAKFASDNNTHISTRVMGTFGYLAPEYASSGKLTDKSDVFSFGVVLLELITGQKPVDSTHTYIDDSLVDWARSLMTRAMEDGNYDTLVDSRLGRKYNPHEMAQLVACAASCVRHSARRRPSMSQIVRALEGDTSLEDLSEGIRPVRSAYSYGSSDYDSSQYNEDLKKFRRMALASRGNVSSEYSAPTSEYGRIPSALSSEGQQMQEMEMTSKVRKDGTSPGLSSGSQL